METFAPIDSSKCWPALPLADWNDTCDTLHMLTQMVGKVRLALTPLVNHWWNVPLYVNERGLTTSGIPYRGTLFELQFDFVDHRLVLHGVSGEVKWLPLNARPVAVFYREFRQMLREAGIEVKIWKMPVEVPNPIPFDEDEVHSAYDGGAVQRFWRILMSTAVVFERFRAEFIAKSSPVHFFWGSFDLAVTRFSGRRAPERAGADAITREAYSHEAISVGFWPGAGLGDPAYYAYAAPQPEGFSQAVVRPSPAHYDGAMKEFILMYEDVRESASPSIALLDFCQSTYDAGATLAHWDRDALERRPAMARASV